MAFIISNAENSFSESEKANSNHPEEDNTRQLNSITRELHLRSSPNSTHYSNAESLNKEAVLRRIRYHKCLNKVKSTFHALVGGSGGQAKNLGSVSEQRWLDLEDAFSSP